MGQELFDRCLAALRSRAAVPRMSALSSVMRRRLSPYAVHPPAEAWALINIAFCRRALDRLTGRRRRTLGAKGAIIAVVGAEATGKSTIAAEIAKWLGREFDVIRMHAGKPPSSPLTAVPNVLLPLMRALFPRQRTSRGRTEDRTPARTGSLGRLRMVMLAYDRRRLLERALRFRARGAIVVCDRYPSTARGVMDSPRIEGDSFAARLERGLYGGLPVPDLVMRLSVPVEEAVRRNRERVKVGKEDGDYVRHRHDEQGRMDFGKAPTVDIDTGGPIEDTLGMIRRLVWDYI